MVPTSRIMGALVPAPNNTRILLNIEIFIVPGTAANCPPGKKTGINLLRQYSSIKKKEINDAINPIIRNRKKP